jgi:regulator of sigma E protease
VTGYPADRAGIRIDDEVLALNALPITAWKQLSDGIHALPNQEVTLRYRRDGQEFKARLTTKVDDATGFGVIGIMPESIYKPVGLPAAVWEGAAQCYSITAVTAKTIASKIYHRQRVDLAGPVGITQMVGRAAHGRWEDLVFVIGFISVAIGFFNLMPVPLLDGGHAFLYLWEGLSRRKLTQELMSRASNVGFVLLALLVLFATYSDIVRLRGERAARQEPATEAAP